MNSSGHNNHNPQTNGQASAHSWSISAEILMPNITQVLNSALEKAIIAGIYSQDEIAEFVAQLSLRWPVPPKILPLIQDFVTNCCDLTSQQQRQIKEFLLQAGTVVHPRKCFLVFHHGQYYYYYDELQQEVLKLREKVLFWIDLSAQEFFSRGKRREKNECPPPRGMEMLRFLCRVDNAGREIEFSELYSNVWQASLPPSRKQMCNSIDVTQNTLNTFAEDRFIICKSKKDDAKVVRIRGSYKFKVGIETPNECCIIKALTRA
jgi:hypothetical protein